MEDFRNKLVSELEEFNKNVDEKLKDAGELHLEQESDGNQVDLEKDKNELDIFSKSYSQMGKGEKGLQEP